MAVVDKSEVWLRYSLQALAGIKDFYTPEAAAIAVETADRMTDEWENRFGDRAFMLAGQAECAACHRPLDGNNFKASVDGIKFCNDACLKGSGREE